MADNLTNRAPLLPGRRVIVFPAAAGADATIAYHGEVVSFDLESVQAFPESPDSWRYRVLVGNRELDVDGSAVLPVGVLPSQFKEDEDCSILRICFAAQPKADNEELSGTYHLGAYVWGNFRFQKGVRTIPAYQYSLSAEDLRGTPSHLEYDVPFHCRLDQRYVLETLLEFFGGDKSPEDSPPPIESP